MLLNSTPNTLIDTHCHINLMQEYSINDTNSVLQKSSAAHVTTIINVGTTYADSLDCIELAKKYPDHIKATVGIHPTEIDTNWHTEFREIKKLITHNNTETGYVVALGETGLDFYHPGYNKQEQIAAFKAHIDYALEYNLAIIIHSRNAHDETLKVIEEYRTNNLRAVLHCFSGDLSIARTVYQWGYALGIGGTVTYPKNNDLRAVCTELPLDAFVLETDAPYLPPQGFRGTQNSPAHILTIAHYIAELRHESLEEIATNTTKRARILFNIS